MAGVRTKTGCYTCRLRKKKCDEQHPVCMNCCSREILCYGYGTRPEWMLQMSSWKQIMESSEAKFIRESAEITHKRRRRDKSAKNIHDGASQLVNLPATTLTAIVQDVRINNVPSDSILFPVWLDLRSDARLLIAFVDVIFPTKFGLSVSSATTDQSWLYHSLLVVEPLYHAVKPFGQSSVHNSKHKEFSDVDADATRLQLGALHGLQQCLAELGDERYSSTKHFLRGTQALAIMAQLVSLEVFSYVEGQWEMHLEAARTIMGMFQNKWAPGLFVERSTELGQLGLGNKDKPQELFSTEDPRTLEFFVASFVWVDIIANATFGPPPFNPRHFNYIHLLANGSFQPQSIIGCQSCIMKIITEITAIEAWKNAQLEQGSLSVVELVRRATSLSESIILGIQNIDSKLSDDSISAAEADSGAVNQIFAYASLVYLHTIISGSFPHTPEIRQSVTRCLEKLEVIPAHLFVRGCWPFTIAGSMATEDLYERFRGVLTRMVMAGHALGSTRKGLKVMEECWRLRRFQPGVWDWRSTMKMMNIKILLI